MGWQKIDDQFGISRKVTRIPRRYRLAAVGLWELASNYSARSLTDGVLDAIELEEVLATEPLTRQLVAVNLWHAPGHDCTRCVQPPAGGVVIHDYLEYNPSRADVENARESDRKRKGIQKDSGRNPRGIRKDSRHPDPVPNPNPVPMTDMTNEIQVSHELYVAGISTDPEIASLAKFAGIRNLEQLQTAMSHCCGPISGRGAVELAKTICARSKHTVEKVDAYVLTAITETPDEVRWDYERLDLGAIA